MIPAIGWPILIVVFIVGFYYMAKFEDKWEELKEGKKIAIIWPNITSKNIALVVGYRCAFISFIFSGISIASHILIAILDKSKINIWWFADGIIMFAVGYGIYKMSRFAAVLGLIFYGLGRIYLFINGSYITSFISLIIFGLVYVNAIRATMVYHKNTCGLDNIIA